MTHERIPTDDPIRQIWIRLGVLESVGGATRFLDRRTDELSVSPDGSKQTADQTGSVPVKTVEIPALTATIENRSSSMEPTLHCAQPAQGCEAVVSDGAVVQETVLDPRRGDILLFRTPHLAAVDVDEAVSLLWGGLQEHETERDGGGRGRAAKP